MSRSTFAGTAGDFLATISNGGLVRAIPGSLTIWSAKTGGTQYTDLLLGGAPVTSIPVGRDGQVPQFQGPDGVNEVWADAGGGSRVRLVPDIVGVLTGEDAAVSTLVNAPASDTRTALNGLIESGADARIEVADLIAGGRKLPIKRVTNLFLPKWDAAIQLMRAGVRDAKILCVGDSTTAGVGGGTDASYVQAGSWPHHLVGLLNDGFWYAANGLQTPRATSGGTPVDTRWTLGAGWSKGDGANATTAYIGFGGMGSNYWASFDAAETLTFNDPRIEADTFDIYYLTTTGTGAEFTAQATGGAVSASTPTGGLAAKGIGKLTVSAGSLATTNVVTIDPGGSAGAVYIVGIEPYRSGATKRIRVGNAAASGSYAFRWAGYSDNNSSNTWNSLYAIRAYAPDLTIIDLGINDADPSRETLATTFDAYIGDIIAAAQYSGDVLLKTFIPVAGREAMMDQYAEKLRAHNLALVDIYEAWGTAEEADAAGFVHPDGIHGTSLAYQVEAGLMYLAITSARPDGTRSGPPVVSSISGPAGTNRTLALQTDGVGRWLLRTTTTAETGSNAGSDLELVARTDAGAALITVFQIARSTGRITFTDGVNIGTGTGTGTKIGATNLQKLAFWGKTPIAQPAAIPDTSGADLATLEAEVNQLKALLRSVGLMAT